jgi:hypothetical protein
MNIRPAHTTRHPPHPGAAERARAARRRAAAHRPIDPRHSAGLAGGHRRRRGAGRLRFPAVLQRRPGRSPLAGRGGQSERVRAGARSIVKAIIAQAKHQQVPTLFALTRAVPFFQKMGFAISSRELFPEKVWRDCNACPLLTNCDETAVVLHLTPQPIQLHNYSITQLPILQPIQGVTKMSKPTINKAVLAYSGGLDTSVIVPWLRENYDCEVICFCANIGQGEDELKGSRKKRSPAGPARCMWKICATSLPKISSSPCCNPGAIYERQLPAWHLHRPAAHRQMAGGRGRGRRGGCRGPRLPPAKATTRCALS